MTKNKDDNLNLAGVIIRVRLDYNSEFANECLKCNSIFSKTVNFLK
jgi:hypothetical protein